MASAASMPAVNADLVTFWSFLEDGLNNIMANPDIEYSKYMSLYIVIYNYCTSVDRAGAIADRTGANLMGADLYNNLVRYFVTHLKPLCEKSDSFQDEDLLQYYAYEWEKYSAGANFINRISAYLNRHWIKRERDKGRKGVYPVYTLALVQWKDNLFVPVQQKHRKLGSAILRLIELHRNGEIIDQGLVKKVVDSMVLLGLDQANPEKACLDVYKEHFEVPFIDATEQYYKNESESFLAENSLSNYLIKVEKRLREEEDRVQQYLDPGTRKPLITNCEHVLIQEHSKLMWDNFQALLDNDKDEDLQRMYALLSRIPEGLEPLHKIFEEHVKKAGLAAVAKLIGRENAAEEGDADAVDPEACVDALLDVHKKNSDTVRQCFGGEDGFIASLDAGCREFVNHNATTGAPTSKLAKLLVKHADLLLQKISKVEEDALQAALSRVMLLFKYIEDKDVQQFYMTQLSKRLIHGASAPDDSEVIAQV
ncbi:CULLIN-2 domain-containing protein [Mycena venus]|uniref:Cullin-1 n=1 Tax=Mycena venus TaxID=2733690 RepID=A0A8H7CNH5_9AGAR|nr:CULLIN-2 domain-containing protein [Mycena venus]